nr:Tetratricopeptide repeat-like superfamily protein, putative [Ipomoea batatas]
MSTSKTKPFHNGYSQFVSENQENGSDISLRMMSMTISWMRDALLRWMPVEPLAVAVAVEALMAGEVAMAIVMVVLVEMEVVKCDFVKAEEYFGRAILANANEENIFALANIICCSSKSYYDPTLKASPDYW